MENFEVILRGRSINIRYTNKGNFPIPTGIQVDPNRFQNVHGSWVLTEKGKPDPVINPKINKKLSELGEKKTKYFLEWDVYPTADEFKYYIAKGERKVYTFESAWAEFMHYKTHNGPKSIGPARKQKYDLVKSYIDKLSPGMRLQGFDAKWAAKWIEYHHSRGMKINAIGGLCNCVISFLHYCDDFKIIAIPKLVFQKLRVDEEDLDIFFHPVEELRMMLNKDLSKWPDLADTRDKYCLECMTGMRVSDLFSHDWVIDADFAKKAAVKTREAISVPLRPEARELIRRMKGRAGGERIINEVQFNREIKEIGELCDITMKVRMVLGKRKFKAGHEYYKYELMSSHMARATFICQMIELDVHFQKIMAMTGISSVNTLKKYAAVLDKTLSETMEMVVDKQRLTAA